VKLPTPPTTLQLSKIKEKINSNLSEFQEELVWLASSIIGEDVPKSSTVPDAAQFVKNATSKFFDAAATTKAEGTAHPDHILQL